MNRRTLLKTGVVGGALLVVGGAAATFSGRNLLADRKAVLAALVPAILQGVPGFDGNLANAIEATETAIAGLPSATQAEINQLFTLLAATPTRLLLTGMAKPWSSVSLAEAASVLDQWRFHRLALLQSAYHAFHDLILGGWYGDEAHWAALKYVPPQAYSS